MSSHPIGPEATYPTPPHAPQGLVPIHRTGSGPEGLFGSLVRDIMTRKVVVVETTDTLRFAATLLSQKGISGMPVLGKDRQVVGVLSEKDVVKALGDKGGLAMPGSLFELILEPSEARQKDLLARCRSVLDSTRVGSVMTSPARWVSPDTPSLEAARQMLVSRINRLPVVEHGKLVGILTRNDVLRLSSETG